MYVEPKQYVKSRYVWVITLSTEEAKDLVWLAKVIEEREITTKADVKLNEIATRLVASFNEFDPTRAFNVEQKETLIEQ
jgi:hypothetical protein